MPGITKQDSPLHITQGLSVAADEDVVLNDMVRISSMIALFVNENAFSSQHFSEEEKIRMMWQLYVR